MAPPTRGRWRPRSGGCGRLAVSHGPTDAGSVEAEIWRMRRAVCQLGERQAGAYLCRAAAGRQSVRPRPGGSRDNSQRKSRAPGGEAPGPGACVRKNPEGRAKRTLCRGTSVIREMSSRLYGTTGSPRRESGEIHAEPPARHPHNADKKPPTRVGRGSRGTPSQSPAQHRQEAPDASRGRFTRNP